MSAAFSIVVAVNDDRVLHGNLLALPTLQEDHGHQLLLRRGFASASLEYNNALDEADHDLVIFVHQDVYLPKAWFADLQCALDGLAAARVTWGVLGAGTAARKGAVQGIGRIYTRGLGRHGVRIHEPEPIDTLDEIVLILRKSSGLRFDRRAAPLSSVRLGYLPGGPAARTGNAAFQGYCVHNTNQVLILPPEFYTCYRYMRRKWAGHLPIYTSCMKISYLNDECYRRRIVEAKQRAFGMRSRPARRAEDPTAFASEPG